MHYIYNTLRSPFVSSKQTKKSIKRRLFKCCVRLLHVCQVTCKLVVLYNVHTLLYDFYQSSKITCRHILFLLLHWYTVFYVSSNKETRSMYRMVTPVNTKIQMSILLVLLLDIWAHHRSWARFPLVADMSYLELFQTSVSYL